MRIIAGTAGGRRFDAPSGRNTRPTLDRVKEAMFGMIQFDVEGRRVLDLFAGSGNLGLEALSRGAEYAVFCDSDRNAAGLVESNIKLLGFADRGEVSSSDCFNLLSRLAQRDERFSLVLLDPPYNAGLTEKVLNALVELKLLSVGCIILAEHSQKIPIDMELLNPKCLDALEFRTPRKYGDVGLTYIRFNGGEK